MKFIDKVSPNYRDKDHSTVQIMGELVGGLLLVFAFSMLFYYMEYGIEYVIQGVWLLLTSVGVALLTETAYALARKRKVLNHIKNSFPLVTAIILVMMVTIDTPAYAIAIGSFAAIFLGKLIFGGFGHNIFNPAGVGRFVIISTYAGAKVADVVTGATPITSIANAGWIIKDAETAERFLDQFGGLWNLFLGWYPGAIGETSALLILLVGVYLAYRKVLDWKVPVVYIVSMFVFSWVIGLYNGVGIWYPLFSILSGGVFFGAVFMLTDPVTNPTTISGRIIFAIGVAVITILVRLQGNLPGGVIRGILMMNLVSPLLDRLTDGWSIYNVKKYTIAIASAFVIGLIATFFAGANLESKAVEIPAAEGEIEEFETDLTGPMKVFRDITANVPEITSETEEGESVVFLVETPGYAVVEGYAGAVPNVVEVTIAKADKTVERVRVLEVADTPNFGTEVQAKNFVDQFLGLSLSDSDAEVDVASGATVSSVSVAKAVQVALEAME